MLTVGGTYVEDVPVDAAWVHFVRSEYAHGRILSYDVDDARKVPGVLGVFTGEDLDLPPFPHVQPILKTGSERPLIAKGTVRFVGEPTGSPTWCTTSSSRPVDASASTATTTPAAR